jgi:hypothetical protein
MGICDNLTAKLFSRYGTTWQAYADGRALEIGETRQQERLLSMLALVQCDLQGLRPHSIGQLGNI